MSNHEAGVVFAIVLTVAIAYLVFVEVLHWRRNRWLHIWWLKRRARKEAMFQDRMLSQASCGRHVLREISPDFDRSERAFSALVKELQAVDPRCPQ